MSSVPLLKPHSRGPGGKAGRELTIAVMRRTAAGLVMVTGLGGFLSGFPLGITLRVTAVAAAGTISLAWRAGSQVTWASTRMAVWPLPASATSTVSSLESSTAGTGGSP